jgi:hypothetical protein
MMRFYTPSECEEWITARERPKPDVANAKPSLRLNYPSSPHRVYAWAHSIASSITFQQPCLLWITEWSTWPSSENLHLYYRVRQSYQDSRLIDEAPGHHFLGHEITDMASFLQMAMLNGWGGYILSAANRVNAFFSHDEFIDFYSDDKPLVEEIHNALINRKPT